MKILFKDYLKIKLINLLLISLIFPFKLSAQTYSFKKYTANEGLFPVAVNKIFQDSRGILWIGGIGGLSKYDGYKFKKIFNELNEQITVKDINEDSKGNIWIATEEKGVAVINPKYDNANWLSSDNNKIPTNSITTILFDKEKNVWLGTNQGIIIISKNDSIKTITKENGLLRNYVNKMIIDSSSNIWVSDGGLARLYFEEGEIRSFERIHEIPLISLAVGKDNSILYGTIDLVGDKRMGVYRYKNGKQTKILNPGNYSDPIKPLSIYDSDDGVVWVGTTRGLFLIYSDKIIRIRTKNGLINENISSIIKDRENNTWISTNIGALKLTNRYFINFTENDGLLSSTILTGMIDKDDNIWFGGWSGLYKIDANLNLSVHNISYSQNHQVHSLIQDKKGVIWVGKYRGLNYIKDNSLGECKIKKNLNDIFVKSFTSDKKGNIYAGLTGEIIVLENNKIVKRYNTANGIKNSSFNSMVIDEKERIWFCQESGGLGLIKNDTVKYFTNKDGLPSNEINQIFIDSKKRIWLATPIGLVLFSDYNYKCKVINCTKKKIINVRCLNEDSKGNLWIGTDIGVFEWSDSLICSFESRDGLAGDIISTILIDKNDNLIFGTNSGISLLKCHDRNLDFPIPKIWIELVSEKNEDVVLHNTSVLNYNNNSIHFKLVSPSFYDEGSIEYAYMLKEFETEWSLNSNQRIIRYSHLKPGKYNFLAKAKNRNGKWSDIAVYNIEILPPYWQTWWFRIIFILIIISIGILLYKRRITLLKKENENQQKFSRMLIESQEAERKRIASELHDGLGQELLTIINRAKIALKNPEKYPPEKQFKEISESALNSIEEVRRIARNLHPYQLDSLGLTNITKGLIEKFKETSDINVEYSIDDIDNILSVEKEINIYRIVQECINNIIKHSKASHVKILIEKKENELFILISDNGAGISYQQQQEIFNNNTGFGLVGIRERTKYLNGIFNLESSEGFGVSVKIIIPLEGKSE